MNNSLEDFGGEEYEDLMEGHGDCQPESRPTAIANSEGTRIHVESHKASQWATIIDGVYKASGETIPSIPAGVYTFGFDQQGTLMVLRTKIVTDELVILPDTASEQVLSSISHFWGCKHKFERRKQVFKRGIMLYGPAGSGKTATIMLLTKDIIKRDGIVVYANRPEICIHGLKTIRQVEPSRPIICVLEDIDEIVAHYGEHELLSLLDGEMQTDNVVFLATTNYPDRLAKRIINRPSRFDEVIKIGMPSELARSTYLRSRLTVEELPAEELGKWVADTDKLSIAHLKELMVCVFCLGRDYEQTLVRLRAMDRVLNNVGDHRIVGLGK